MSTVDITKVTPPVSSTQSTQNYQAKAKADTEVKTDQSAKKSELENHAAQPKKMDTMWPNLSEEELKEVTEWLNNSMRLFNFRLQFEIRQHPNHIVAKVLDKETGEVIREVPPESLSSMIERMRNEMGVFVDEII